MSRADNTITAKIGDDVDFNTLIVDSTSTEALLVRKDLDGGDVFTIDTVNSIVKLGSECTLTTPVIKSNSGTTSVTTGGNVLTSFRSKSGFITVKWFDGVKIAFFDWAEGVNNRSIDTISTTSSSNTVALTIVFNNPDMDIIATSNSTLNVHWDVLYTGSYP